ncbi:MAG: hypothetical protein ACKODX_00250 [Gemmata sp.]
MKRFYLAAAGLCVAAPCWAQEGALAPTAPVVPVPELKNGSLVAPGGGPSGAPRLFARPTWSPLRSPVVTSGSITAEAVYAAPPTTYGRPPLPAGVSPGDAALSAASGPAVAPADCGPAGCGTHARGGINFAKLKAWLSYTPSSTVLPRFQPAPYTTPLQGAFGCTSGSGCATGCVTDAGTRGYAPAAQPPFVAPQQPTVPAPTTPGAVPMPPRGAQGTASQPAQARALPAAAEGYRFAPPEVRPAAAQKPAFGPVVGAVFQRPAQR